MDPTLFSEGFTMRELLDSSRGFTLTADSGLMKPRVFDDADDLLDDNEEEILNISSSDRHMQAPKYRSFDDLATTMRDVVPTGAIKIFVSEEGDGAAVPTDSYVKLHYAAYWENEERPFDNTMAWNNAEPLRLKMGSGAMMPGLEIGLEAVRGPSAKFRLLLSPEAMCGKLGALPRIRPERALYCVTLVAVEDIGLVDRFTSLPSAEQRKFSVTIETVEASNAHAKTMFSKKRYPKAIESYHMSLEVLNLSSPETEEQMDIIKQSLMRVYTNLAVCYTKMERPKKVLQMCDNITRIAPIAGNPRALYLYGKAQARCGEYDEALTYLKMALRLQPKNEDTAREMAALEKKILVSKVKEKTMWKGAFSEKAPEQTFDVPEDFEEDTLSMLRELSRRDGFVEFRLPKRMTEDEVGCTKRLIEGFKELCFSEDQVRGEKTYKIVKIE